MMISRKNGFTLVETLVAISILMICITGPLYSIFQAVQVTYVSRDQLIATSLAQEGVEYVRNKRDANYLFNVATPSTPVPWMSGLSACTDKTCMVDTTAAVSVPPVSCSGTCSPLYLSSQGLYNNSSSGTATRFTRSVKIATIPGNADEVIVTSTVTWITTQVPYTITVTERLYNWL